MAVSTYTKTGARASTPAKLDKSVFGLKVDNHQLLKDAYLAYLASGRSNFAKTKKRGEVRGGGIKPWRQKGTGRARFGSSRNPIWTGGGVAFGPTGNENYTRKITTSSKRLAIRQALSLAAASEKLKIVDSLDFKESRVKPIVNFLSKIDAKGKILLVIELKNESSERATRNLDGVKTVSAKYLTVFDILNADQIVMTNKSLEIVQQWLGETK